MSAGPAAARRSRMTAPAVTAWALLALIGLLSVAGLPLGIATRYAGSGYGTNLIAFIVLLPVALVGFVVARRQPGNPIGWMFLGLVTLLALGGAGADYAWLSYRLGHHLPLAVVGVFLAPGWVWLFLALPLVILLFPDGRLPSPRWRPVLWGYLVVGACLPLSVYAVTTLAVAAGDIHLAPGGDLVAVDGPPGSGPVGSPAWLGSVQGVILPVLALFWLVFVARQVLSWRRASGERRQQLKWLMSGAAMCSAALAVTVMVGTLDPSAPPAIMALANIAFIGVAALPISIGVAILKYRLYDIDRIISRTLGYTIVTGLLVGIYAGLVLLATRVLPLSSPVAVAAATLAAAALFNPVRRWVQRLVDRRFNRARYDADQTVAAFAARLQDDVGLDSVRDDLASVVRTVLEPAQVSVWLSQRG